MRAHLISSFVPGPASRDLDWFHYEMFHGTSDRQNLPDSLYAQSDEHPLLVTKNLYDLAPVWEPQGGTLCLVVSETVRARLADLPAVRFYPVRFVKVFRLKYAPGDFSWQARYPSDEALRAFLEGLPHDPVLAREVPPYFEMRVPFGYEIRKEFGEIPEISVPMDGALGGAEEVAVNAAVLQKYAVCSPGVLVCTDAVFAVLEPFLDWRYFRHASVSL